MRILDIEQNTDAWYEARKGKITGSKLKDIVVKRGTGRKVGFYELLADKLAAEEPEENAMDRGGRLEDVAVESFATMTGKTIERVGLCVADFNEGIAVSPDGLIRNDGKYTGAVEVKCLSAARHLQALIEQAVPDEYYYQVLQYFIVNEDLETLYFVFYDPRITIKPLHYLTVTRESLYDDVETYKTYQIETMAEVNRIIEELAF